MTYALDHCGLYIEHCKCKEEECLKAALQADAAGNKGLTENWLQWAITWEERKLFWQANCAAR